MTRDTPTRRRPIERSEKFEKFIDQQLARYEKDKLEGEGVELKRVGLELLGSEIGADEYGCDPDLLRFPARIAEAAARLDTTDQALLTRTLYAFRKEATAQNEMITVDWNLRAIRATYGTYSKEYFVEWQETNDEMDHIHAFNSIAKKVLGQPLSVERYEQRDRFRRLAFERFDRYFRCPYATPALYFSLRYVANVQLRSFEQFCMSTENGKRRYNEHLVAINRMHFFDESRHFASSLSFSLDLIARITIPHERELLLTIVSGYILDLINFTRTRSVELLTSRSALEATLRSGALRSFPLGLPEIDACYRDLRFGAEAEQPGIAADMARTTCRRLRSFERALGVTRATYERRGLCLRNALIVKVLDTMKARAADEYNGNANYSKTLASFAESYDWFERQLS
jgi:hypothetical protein